VAAPAVLGVRHRGVAVVLVALTCLKPQVGLIVVVVLLAQRRWREAVGAMAIAGTVSLVVAGVLAGGIAGLPGWFGTFLDNVRSATSVRVGQATVEERVDIEGALLALDVQAPGPVLALITVIGLLLVFATTRWGWRRHLPATGALLGLTVGLLPIYHISYDAAWLAVPIVVAAAELYRTTGSRGALACAPGLGAIAAATWMARWHEFDERFGAGTGVFAQRVLLLVGLVALAGGLVAAVDAGRSAGSAGRKVVPAH
jgi:hypothetical protein